MPKQKSKSKAKVPEQDVQYLDLRGANGDLFNSTEPEVVLSGPSDTGKSVACVLKLHATCSSVPGVQCVMARKTFNSNYGIVI